MSDDAPTYDQLVREGIELARGATEADAAGDIARAVCLYTDACTLFLRALHRPFFSLHFLHHILVITVFPSTQSSRRLSCDARLWRILHVLRSCERNWMRRKKKKMKMKMKRRMMEHGESTTDASLSRRAVQRPLRSNVVRSARVSQTTCSARARLRRSSAPRHPVPRCRRVPPSCWRACGTGRAQASHRRGRASSAVPQAPRTSCRALLETAGSCLFTWCTHIKTSWRSCNRGAVAMVAAMPGGREALFPFYDEVAGVFVVRFFRNRTRFDVLVVCLF